MKVNKVTIIMKDWVEGLEKVSLTKLQREVLYLSLVESKRNVDKLLDGEEITIEISDNLHAEQFVLRARKIGVICDYIEQ